MKRTVLVSSCLSITVLLLSVSAALGGPPGTFTITENARATAYTSEHLPVVEGQSAVIQTLVLEPGFSSGWHHHPDDAFVLMKKGKLTQYTDCNNKIVWEAGKAYYHAAGERSAHADDHGPQLARNEGSEPVEITILFLNVPQGQTPGLIPRNFLPPPAECPTLT